MRKIFFDKLERAARVDERIWLLTADLGYSFIESFARAFPARFVNVGVAEQNLVGIASGLALTGKKVFIYSIINFVTMRCLEQLRQNISYHKLDVTIVGVGTGFAYADAGYSHHGIEDIAIMRMLPYMQIASPADQAECACVMQRILQHQGPWYLRLAKEEKTLYSLSQQNESEFLAHHVSIPIQVRAGKDIAIVATGNILELGLQAWEKLCLMDIEVQVWSFPVIQPIDVLFIKKHLFCLKGILVIEEHRKGGFFTILLEILHSCRETVLLEGIFLGDDIIHSAGTREELLEHQGLTVNAICHSISRIHRPKRVYLKI